jgi:hypothetical protein
MRKARRFMESTDTPMMRPGAGAQRPRASQKRRVMPP